MYTHFARKKLCPNTKLIQADYLHNAQIDNLLFLISLEIVVNALYTAHIYINNVMVQRKGTI